MSRRILTTAFFATLLGAGAPLQAQSTAPIVGKWAIDYERGRRVENDVVTPVMAKGTITIAVDGDSLIATLDQGPRPDGTPTPAAKLGGRISNGSAVFLQSQQVRMNMNGEEHVQTIKVTWTLKADGDALSGTMAREMPNMQGGAPSAVSGTRVKA